MAERKQTPTALAWGLGGALLTAIFMGAGPGVYLVNPDANGAAPPSVAGIPVLYAWYLFWLCIEALVVCAAFLLIWRKEGTSE